MLTQMTELDWDIAIEVFRAVRRKRGEPGHDDRKFLEALHYLLSTTSPGGALPAEFGNWNSVCWRFWRLSQTGNVRGVFRGAGELKRKRPSGADVRFHPSCGRMCPWWAQRGAGRPGALGKSRGGFSNKNPFKNR